MIYNFFAYVRQKLEERRTELIAPLVSGTIHSMEEYKLLTGKLKGIEESIVLLTQAYKVLADSKDEDQAYADR